LLESTTPAEAFYTELSAELDELGRRIAHGARPPASRSSAPLVGFPMAEAA
jgi:hypothetical protein